MTAKDLKTKYPDVWAKIESATIEDLKMWEERGDIIFPFDDYDKTMKKIAHNAAFNGTMEHHRALKAL